MPVRPLAPLPDSLAGLRAALPAAAGVVHGDPGQRMVALTFDDGPSGRTPAILRVLANHGAHATFFVVGRATRGMEPVLRHIAASGNELADHTYSHANLLALHAPGRTQQLRWTKALVERATGVEPRFFRPPYGATGPAVNRLGRSLGHACPCCGRSTAATGSCPGRRRSCDACSPTSSPARSCCCTTAAAIARRRCAPCRRSCARSSAAI